jgi:hypothetical protein
MQRQRPRRLLAALHSTNGLSPRDGFGLLNGGDDLLLLG